LFAIDFDLDDDCNEIVPLSQNEIEKCLNTIGEKESALSEEGKDVVTCLVDK
jgi:predicted mannosyl-3-phosphoglycerate phosphatase (HAD superfamily)